MSDLIDPKELARRLGVPVSFIYDRTCRNAPDRIPHIKLGKYVRFDWAKVELWLEDHERGE